MMHLYSALLCMAVHPKRFTIMGVGGAVHSPHTSYSVERRESHRVNQVDGDY